MAQVVLNDLVKAYDDVIAVDRVSLTIGDGEGLVGHALRSKTVFDLICDVAGIATMILHSAHQHL